MFYDKKFIIVSGLLMSAAISATDHDLEKWFRTQEKKVNERAALVTELAKELTKLDQHERRILEEIYPVSIIRDAEKLKKYANETPAHSVPDYLINQGRKWMKFLRREGLNEAQRKRIKAEILTIKHQIDRWIM